jgi:hypothetical protein
MVNETIISGNENQMDIDFNMSLPVIHQLDSQEWTQHLCGTCSIRSCRLS